MLLITSIKLRLRRHRGYWTLRYALQWLRFVFASRRFRVSRGFEESTGAVSIFWVLTRESFIPILSAILLSGVVNLVLDVRWALPSRAPLDGEAYVTLMGTIAGVTGIFLALYFAAVSTVAGAIYNRVPNDVRELLVREKVGGFYVSLLAFITAFTLLLLGYRGFGFPPSPWGMVASLVLVTPGVFSFAKLGQRVFYFFDPTALADTLFRELRTYAAQASRRGYRWADPSFQDHYRKQANRALRTLETLVAFAKQEEILRGRPLASLALKSLWSVGTYLRIKRQIPSDSRWFEQVPRFAEWYFADSTAALELATATMTGLTPKMLPEAYWLENHLVEQADLALRSGLGSIDPFTAANILDEYSDLMGRFGQEWEVNFARERSKKVVALFLAELTQMPKGPADDKKFRASLALGERVAMLPISTSLGLVKSVDSLDLARLRTNFEALQWRDQGSIYDLGLPAPIREQLEYISRRLPFEIGAEGDRVSPQWYLTQLLFMRLAEALRDNLDTLLQWINSFFPSLVRELRTAGYPAHAALVCAKGVEACAKLDRHLSRYQEFGEVLARTHILADLKRTEFPFDGWGQTIQKTMDDLHVEYATLIPALSRLKRDSDLPDFFGEAVHRVGEACFQSLLDNRPGHFERLFPAYFYGIFGIVEEIRKKAAEFDLETLAPFVVEPLMDLVALSGYAFAAAQLHQNRRLWRSCIKFWNALLSGPEARSKLEYLGAALKYRRGLFRLTPRDIMRTRWMQAFEGALRTLPRESVSGPGEYGYFTRPHHASPLIRIMGREMLGSMYDGIDIFVAMYLRHNPLASGIDFGRDDLSESLELLRTRGEEEDDEQA